MANWVTNYIEVPNLGKDVKSGRVDVSKDYNVIDAEVVDDNMIRCDSKWRPPLSTVARLSKDLYPGQDVFLSHMGEGNPMTEFELRLRDGKITGHWERENNGFEEPKPFDDFIAVDAKESQQLLDDVASVDAEEIQEYERLRQEQQARESRVEKAEALSEGLESGYDGMSFDMG